MSASRRGQWVSLKLLRPGTSQDLGTRNHSLFRQCMLIEYVHLNRKKAKFFLVVVGRLKDIIRGPFK